METITECLFLLSKIYGHIKHPNQADALEAQGMIFANEGNLVSAKDAFQSALDILHEVFGNKNEHESTKRIEVILKNLQDGKFNTVIPTFKQSTPLNYRSHAIPRRTSIVAAPT